MVITTLYIVSTDYRFSYSKRRISMALVSAFIVYSTLLSGCSAFTEQGAKPEIQVQQAKPHKISIVNASRHVINTVAYKPCGSDSSYQTLTNMLHPNEKLSINIYTQCVDLMATNAFRKKLVDAKNIDLQKTKSWTIK